MARGDSGRGRSVRAAAEEAALDGQTRRRLQSRRRLLDAAARLFVERGYDRTRPQDVAREAGVATGTFYLHFRDKEAAFLAFAEEAQARLLEECRDRLSGIDDLGALLRAFLATLFDFAQRHPGVLQAAFLDPVMIAPGDEDAWRLYDRFGRIFSETLGRAAARGAIAADYDIDLISHALGGALRHGTIFGGRRGYDAERVADQLTLFVRRGLGGVPSGGEHDA